MKKENVKKMIGLVLAAALVLSVLPTGTTVMATEAEVQVTEEVTSQSEEISEGTVGAYVNSEVITAPEVTETVPQLKAGTYDLYVVNTELNVRSAADASSTKLGVLAKGTEVSVLATKKNTSTGKIWGKIVYKNSYGWISLSFCTLKKSGIPIESTTTTTVAPTTTTELTTESTTTSTTEVTTEEPVMEESTEEKTEDEGDEEKVTETTVSTTEEQNESTTVSTTEAAPATTASTTEAAPTTTESTSTVKKTVYIYKVTATTLNVRSGADTSYGIVLQLSKDTKVTVTDYNSDKTWGKVTVNGKTGWISLAYTTKVGSTVIEVEETTTNKTTAKTTEKTTVTTTEGSKTTTSSSSTTKKNTYEVNASALNMRSGAGTSYSIVGSIPYGTTVTVSATTSDNWGKVTYGGVTGWISLAYCTKVSSSESSSGTTTSGTTSGTTGWKQVNGTWTWYNNGTKLFASNTMYTAWTKIKAKTSGTKYYIVVNCSSCQTFIFTGSANKWVPYKLWSCSPGASRSETVKGTYTVSDRGYSFGKTNSYTCYYWTRFYGGYLFHSVLYYWNSSKVKDGRLGMKLSHGCVRLQIDNAKWIYNNIPAGTKVLTY